MKKNRVEIRIKDSDLERIKKAALLIDMNISELIRGALRFGIPALLKFEKGTKYAWDDDTKEWAKNKKGPTKEPVDQEIAPMEDHGDYIMFNGKKYTKEEFQEICDIAKTPFLTNPEEE